MLDRTTPLILTYNEAPNIGRVLERLAWARRVVVVDSHSDDETESIAKGFPNVSFIKRLFDSHASQWNFGLRETGIDTEWVLALDADYVVPEGFLNEIRPLSPAPDMAGYRAPFRYCIDGRPLRGAVYTPVVVLYRRKGAKYVQDGHTQRVCVEGRVMDLTSHILHDDRKSLDRWMRSQIRYQSLEAENLATMKFSEVSMPDRVRKLVLVAPAAMFFYCMFLKGNVLDGREGFLYAMQRAVAETILSLFLMQAFLGVSEPEVTR